jgi:hypothetical protein
VERKSNATTVELEIFIRNAKLCVSVYIRCYGSGMDECCCEYNNTFVGFRKSISFSCA